MSPKLRESLSVFYGLLLQRFTFQCTAGKAKKFSSFFLFPRTCVFGKINGNELYPRNVGNRLDNSLPKTI